VTQPARLPIVCLLLLGIIGCRKGSGEEAAGASPAERKAAAGDAASRSAPDRADATTAPDAPEAPDAPAAQAPPWPTREPCRLAARKVWHEEVRRMEPPPTPPSPVEGLPAALALALDEGWNACAVTPDHGATCWGVGIRGPLADDPEARSRPGPIAGLADVALVLPAQTPHACTLGLDGSVSCFGAPNNRKLGSAANETWWSEAPARVVGLPKTRALAVGFGFSCALAEDGTVRCWGRNDSGQLGDGTREPRRTPAPVPGLTGVAAIAAGREQACAVLEDRTVRCWGDMLATFCREEVPVPVPVPGLAGVAQLSVGWDHACAVLEDGTVRCWGENDGGQLGDGSWTHRFTPVAVAGLTDAAAVEAGDGVTCAVRRDGTVVCWGKNQCGQADGGASGRPYLETPTPVPGVTGVAQLAVGGMQTCARRTDDGVLCWGATTPPQFAACLAAW